MIWKVVVWLILDIYLLRRFGLIPTCTVILQVEFHIAIIIIITLRCEGTPVYLLFEYYLWGGGAQILW